MKSIFSFLALLLITTSVFGQEINLNKYKYVIVNDKFDFVRFNDGYQTSSLTKFLFNKKGFEAHIENEEMPDDLMNNRCKALFADVKDDSGLLRTKLYIELRDCNGKILYTSPKGMSKLKSYVKAYRVSIKQAFEEISKMPYKYDASLIDNKKVVVTNTKKEDPKKVEVKKPNKVVKKEPKMVVSEVKVKYTEDQTKKNNTKLELLYAQETSTGYQLVNTKPEVVFVLLKTSDSNKYIIKDKNGTFVKSGDHWIAEYYENGKLINQKYQVKF